MRKNIVILMNYTFEIVKKIKHLLRLLQNFDLIMRHQKKIKFNKYNKTNTNYRAIIVITSKIHIE